MRKDRDQGRSFIREDSKTNFHGKEGSTDLRDKFDERHKY